MNRLHSLTASAAAEKIRSGQITAVEYVCACLDRIKKTEPRIKAWVCLNESYAVKQAKVIDKKIKNREPVGKLAGIPVGVKDIFNTFDFPTEMGSPIWKNFTPGNDARVVFRLRQEDAVIPGKTVTAEFAVHTPGPTHNPHRHGYMTGTSSSGSAAAVAAGMVPLALGTQTAGSTIRPASYCGVYGMKPSFGLIPRTGMLKTTDTLDTVGFFAKSADDLRLMFEVLRISGKNYPLADRALTADLNKSKKIRNWRVGLVTDSLWVWDKAEPYARDAIVNLAKRLARFPSVEVDNLTLPKVFNNAHRIHETIYNKTLSYYFSGEYRKKRLVSQIMQELIEKGLTTSPTYFQQALAAQQKLTVKFDRIMEKFDILLTLSTGGEALKGLDSIDRPDSCLIWTLCFAPTINLPVFIGSTRLPFGAQIVARRYRDYSLLRFAQQLHKTIPR